jgi:hypothetical protein
MCVRWRASFLLVGQLVGRRADVMLVVVRRERIGELARAFVRHALSSFLYPAYR